jgi:plastocyanin
VTLLRPGAYTVVVRDRSKAHNARLRGAGASKATGVGFVGIRTWRVVLRKGTLVVQCDPHRATMRATVTIA